MPTKISKERALAKINALPDMVTRVPGKFGPIENKIKVPYTSTVPDYHFICDEWTDKETRKKMNIGDIYANAAVCARCGDYIRSRNRHDYRTCKCKAISVDGGSHYLKRCARVPSDVLERVVLFKDVKDDTE
jgi:hypothetical protein